MVKNNLSFEELYINKTQESRKLLQIQGTEQGRDIYGENIWINYLDAWVQIHKSRGIQVVLCGDIRFKNEFKYIKENNGIVIKVIAPKRNEQKLLLESKNNIDVLNSIKTHPSECDLDNIPNSEFDLVIHNDVNDTIDISEIELLLNKLVI